MSFAVPMQFYNHRGSLLALRERCHGLVPWSFTRAATTRVRRLLPMDTTRLPRGPSLLYSSEREPSRDKARGILSTRSIRAVAANVSDYRGRYLARARGRYLARAFLLLRRVEILFLHALFEPITLLWSEQAFNFRVQLIGRLLQ
jgi:hypothetical protein